MSVSVRRTISVPLIIGMLSLLIVPVCATEPPAILWEKTFNIHGSDTVKDICRTPDGGFAAVGNTFTYSSKYVTSSSAIFLVRTDSEGNELWTRTYNGTGFAQGSAIVCTTDGGFMITGHSSGLQSQDPAILLIKTDSRGDTEWERNYGKGGTYVGNSVAQTGDGGYIVCGWTTAGPVMNFDAYLLKTSPSGTVIWDKRFGGPGSEEGSSVIETLGGGYLVAGRTDSSGSGSNDMFLVRINASGELLWEKTFGKAFYDVAEDVKEIPGEGYVVAGRISTPLDQTYPELSIKKQSVYLVRTDLSGNLIWEKSLGSREQDALAHSVELTPDRGFIIAGQKMSDQGNWDMYVVRTDENGRQVYERSWGGDGFDVAYTIARTSDDGYVVAGEHAKGPGDNADLDADLTRFAPDGGTPGSPLTGTPASSPTTTRPESPQGTAPPVLWERTYTIGVQDQGVDVVETRDGGFVIAGITTVSNTSRYPGPPFPQDAFLIRTDSNGYVIWNRTYGGESGDGANAVRQTADGGFVLAGYTSGPEHHDADRYLVRTDNNGNVLWERYYRSPGFDALNSVNELPDGNFIIAGESDEDELNNRRDTYLAKTDPNGEIIWEKTYPGEYPSGARSLETTSDSGFIISAYGNPSLIKTDSDGDTEWTVNQSGGLMSARQARDGGYIATGTGLSRETGYPVLALLKTDSSGRTEWAKLSHEMMSSGHAVETTTDGGFLAVGTVTTIMGGLTSKGIPFSSAISLVRTSSGGDILWNKTLSPATYNGGMMVRQTSDGGFIVLGNVAEQADGSALYYQGYMPGKVYLAKLASDNEKGTNQKDLTIPLCYAPYLAIFIVFGIVVRKARGGGMV